MPHGSDSLILDFIGVFFRQACRFNALGQEAFEFSIVELAILIYVSLYKIIFNHFFVVFLGSFLVNRRLERLSIESREALIFTVVVELEENVSNLNLFNSFTSHDDGFSLF